jgi:hypothetical protein
MLFADDVVLIDESRIGVDQKLELWRHTLKLKGFRLNRTKTKYIKCQFSRENSNDGDVSLDEQVVPMNDKFRYLGSMLQSDGEIDEDVSHRQTSGILYDKKVPNKLKGKFYRTMIRPAMMYDAEYWATKGQRIQKISVAEIRMLRWICGHTKKDRIRNDDIWDKLRETSPTSFAMVWSYPTNAS